MSKKSHSQGKERVIMKLSCKILFNKEENLIAEKVNDLLKVEVKSVLAFIVVLFLSL